MNLIYSNFIKSITDYFKMCAVALMFNGFWQFGPGLILLTSLYLSIFFPSLFFPLSSIYLIWFIYTFHWPEQGQQMSLDWMRQKSIMFNWFRDLFNYKIVKTADLPNNKNYIVGSHPHGMICTGMTLSFCGQQTGKDAPPFSEMFPGIKTYTVTLLGQFLWPLRRELLMSIGAGAASKRNLEYILNQKEKGQAVTIVIGGLNEAMLSRPNQFNLKLKDRKGFVKLALEQGADLVPMFHFGENNTYRPVVDGIQELRLRNMQNRIKTRCGFMVPLLIGRSMLGLPWGGLIPHKTILTTVIGAPINVEKTENPTQEQIDTLHSIYCEKLQELFETHKSDCDVPQDHKIVFY